jgi:hypothetical protein
MLNVTENLVLRGKADLVPEAYRIQSEQIAYEVPDAESQRGKLSALAKAQ